jgi:hypothetical protein
MAAAGAPSFGEKPIRERGQNLGAPRCPLWPGPKGLENLAQVCVGGGFGPKGLGNSGQALAWVTLFLRASPRKEHGGSIEEVGSEGAICSGSNWGELITHLTGRGSESI